MKKLVFLTTENPALENSGASVRDSALIRLLSRHYRVEVLAIAPARPFSSAARPEKISLSFVERESRPWFQKLHYPLRSYVENGYSSKVERAIERNFEPGAILWISRLALAKYIRPAKKQGFRVVLDEHNVESSLGSELASCRSPSLLDRWQLNRLKKAEQKFCNEADWVVVTSQVDRKKLSQLANRDSLVVPNLIDAQKFASASPRIREKEILFVGTLDYEPNRQGLAWFAEKVLPRIREKLHQSGWSVHVVGARPSAALKALLQVAGIRLSENVPSVVPFMQAAGLCIIPLQAGGGTRLKALEAFAAGMPVISTSKGVEGIDGWAHGENLWIADSPELFAEGILKLSTEPATLQRLGERAQQLALAKYDWRAAQPLIENLAANYLA